MAKTKETTAEEKLRALYDLQIIDRRIDEIRNLRGELPLEVRDLEDEIAGLQTRTDKLIRETKELEAEIKGKKAGIKEAQEKIAKYQEQQNNVRNNREFDAIAKEIEFQELEIVLANKKIKEFDAKIAHKKELTASVEERLNERTSHLQFKQGELDGILAETSKEELALDAKSKELATQIDERLFAAYHRIRGKVNNGLAVVSIERGASAGSYFMIPPQRQMEIAQRKKIVTDEHSGRILVDPELARQEEEKMAAVLAGML
jgi:predicted  nucleic acid-binding Zn-ribbon protein